MFFAFVGLLVWGSYSAYVSANAPRSIKFAISTTKEATFTFDAAGEHSVSPTCGCMTPPVESWRGVTFLSRRMILHSDAARPPAHLTASFPAPFKTDLQPSNVDVEHFRIKKEVADAFPQWIVRADGSLKFPFSEVISQQAEKGLREFNLPFIGDLHIVSESEFPIGSWIPVGRSVVTVARTNDDKLIRISDKPDLAGLGISGSASTQHSPIVELVGKSFLLYFEASSTATFEVYHVKVPFSLRMLLPAGDAEGTNGLGLTAESLARSEYEELARGTRDETTAVEYSGLQVGIEMETASPIDVPMVTIMRHPDLPSANQLNVYGSITKLQLAGATGALMIGKDNYPLHGANLAAAGNIHSDFARGERYVPLALRSGTLTGESIFEGMGTVSINDENVYSWWTEVFGPGGLAALIGLLGTAIGLLKPFFTRREG